MHTLGPLKTLNLNPRFSNSHSMLTKKLHSLTHHSLPLTVSQGEIRRHLEDPIGMLTVLQV